MAIEVKVGESRIVSSGEVLFTRNLGGCVGLALVEPAKNGAIRKRGLAHIHYGDLSSEEEKEFLDANILLSDFLFQFTNPKAYVSYVPCRCTRQGYQNGMFEFIARVLLERGLPLEKVDDLRRYEGNVIDFKDMILKQDKIITQYRLMGGRWLNSDLRKGVVLF